MASKLDRFLREDEVVAVTSLSRATIWRLVKASRFPQPVTITAGRIGWRESAVAAWQADPMNWEDNGAA
ncbi:AlpA family phage regulatory protein [uncultured Pseudomonas sp.]|uniref:helix-turn-helix transcriptional regulator n=1 Tax=uncultured Pseudomonas sp. TaxID=114707 RepID=UPI0025E82AC5|nr:AlpA family phage regulatory protein [uncultured Pseudomonas sp.]